MSGFAPGVRNGVSNARCHERYTEFLIAMFGHDFRCCGAPHHQCFLVGTGFLYYFVNISKRYQALSVDKTR